MNAWSLPMSADIGGKNYRINADYRDVLDILQRLGNGSVPEFVRWNTALALFYDEPIPPAQREAAARWLCDFVECGQRQEEANSGPPPKPLIDWKQDALIIVADVNKVAGQEIRALPFLHWWTFMAYFSAIGEGQLSTLVGIRSKLQRGKKLEKWEQDYYRENKARVDIRSPLSAEEESERERLRQLLR